MKITAKVNTDEIRARRIKATLTMQEAAERAGWASKTQWYALEAGLHQPSAVALCLVAQVLKCSMDDLMTVSMSKSSK